MKFIFAVSTILSTWVVKVVKKGRNVGTVDINIQKSVFCVVFPGSTIKSLYVIEFNNLQLHILHKIIKNHLYYMKY